jgi:hypothetical protein
MRWSASEVESSRAHQHTGLTLRIPKALCQKMCLAPLEVGTQEGESNNETCLVIRWGVCLAVCPLNREP